MTTKKYFSLVINSTIQRMVLDCKFGLAEDNHTMTGISVFWQILILFEQLNIHLCCIKSDVPPKKRSRKVAITNTVDKANDGASDGHGKCRERENTAYKTSGTKPKRRIQNA